MAAFWNANLYGFGAEMKQQFLRDYILTEIGDIKIAVEGVIAGLGNAYTLSEERKYEMQLVMNELLVNCFGHAQPDGKQTVVLRVNAGDGCVRICVQDNGQGFEYEQTQQDWEQEPSDDMLFQEHGRGLKLVRAFCDDIEYFGNGNSVQISIAL